MRILQPPGGEDHDVLGTRTSNYVTDWPKRFIKINRSRSTWSCTSPRVDANKLALVPLPPDSTEDKDERYTAAVDMKGTAEHSGSGKQPPTTMTQDGETAASLKEGRRPFCRRPPCCNDSSNIKKVMNYIEGGDCSDEKEDPLVGVHQQKLTGRRPEENNSDSVYEVMYYPNEMNGKSDLERERKRTRFSAGSKEQEPGARTDAFKYQHHFGSDIFEVGDYLRRLAPKPVVKTERIIVGSPGDGLSFYRNETEPQHSLKERQCRNVVIDPITGAVIYQIPKKETDDAVAAKPPENVVRQESRQEHLVRSECCVKQEPKQGVDVGSRASSSSAKLGCTKDDVTTTNNAVKARRKWEIPTTSGGISQSSA